MHRFLSRSDESADLSALRHARGHPFAGRPPQTYYRYVEEAGVLHRPLAGCAIRAVQHAADDFVAAVENLCIIRVKPLFV